MTFTPFSARYREPGFEIAFCKFGTSTHTWASGWSLWIARIRSMQAEVFQRLAGDEQFNGHGRFLRAQSLVLRGKY